MFRTTSLLKKSLLVVMIAAVGLLAWPAASASAAGTAPEETPPTAGSVADARLELAWARAQTAYERQGNRLDRARDFISKVQTLLGQAAQKGWDTSAIQAALDAFAAALPSARSVHQAGAAIISGHAGFNPGGHVVDRSAALATVRALRQVVTQTHAAMNGTGEALLKAIKAFRQAHLPAEVPAP
jgi:hypothetical protein